MKVKPDKRKHLSKLDADIKLGNGRCKVTKKVIYLNEHSANRVVGLMLIRDSNEKIGIINSYHCEYCGYYHVGHSSKYHKD